MPLASRAVKVTRAVLPEAIDAGATETLDCARLSALAVTVKAAGAEVSV